METETTRPKLTEKRLRDAQAALAPGQRARLWDPELAGYGAIVGGRFVSLVVQRRINGRQELRTIGRLGEPGAPDGGRWTEAKARKQALAWLGQMSQGEDPRAARNGEVSLRDALALHVRNMRKGGGKGGGPCSERSIATIEAEVPKYLGEWLDRPIVDLTAAELDRACARVAKRARKREGSANEAGAALVNRLLSHVSACWNAADRLHDLPGKNPVKRLTRNYLKPKSERVTDFPAWLDRVRTLSPVRRDMNLLMLFTGGRSESVRHARWADVDFERGLLHFTRAKGNRPYTVPLGREMVALLKRRQAENAIEFRPHGGDHGFVFPTLTRTKPYRVIPVAEAKERRAEEGPDGEPVRVKYLPGPHALRRTYNSVALEEGVSKTDREALMNHEGAGVNVKHYGAPADWSRLAKVQARIEAALLRRLGVKRGGLVAG